MGKSFNKGEWSEFYAFLKILTDRKFYAANEDLRKIEDIFYPILKVLRKENSTDKIYDISKENVIRIFCKNGDKEESFLASSDVIKNSVKKIFDKIKNAKGSSFEIPETDSIMEQLKCERIKVGRENKADIKVIIHDKITLRDTEVGFSIKSNIGSKPTLLNASGATNFIYEIGGFNEDYKEINAIGGPGKVRDRISAIETKGGNISFSKFNSEIFEKNLKKIDSLMPIILAEFLLYFFRGEGRTIKDLTDKVVTSDNIKKLNFDYNDIKFKLKYLLLNVALGMVPNNPWDGFLKADGGYIVVKEDGEIVCYHIYNISQFSEYLFNNTKLDTPSTNRHGFGTIYIEDGKHKMNLNLQIRFT